nr:MAG: hypothetical protein CSA76_05610 [Spirochaetales bacterium]
MEAIERIKESGMQLASGGIIDYPGQTLQMLAEDIHLTWKLNVSWVPIIPYLPVPGTPLAEEGGMGSLDLCLRTISILRLLLPDTHINAQQPGKDPKLGLTNPEGNAKALNAGADILFLDLLKDQAGAFRVIEERQPINMDHLESVSSLSGMPLSFKR